MSLDQLKGDLKSQLEKLIVNPPLVSNQEGEQPDGNALLYLGDLVYVWNSFFESEPWLSDLVKLNYADAYIGKGRISRGHHKKLDTQEHDDYTGLAYAAQETGNGWIADEIVEHGLENFWDYEDPIEEPGILDWLKDWHGRFPGLAQHYKLCSDKYQKLGLFNRFWFAISFAFTGKKVDGGGDKMILLRRKAYLNQPNRYWICDWALARWEAGFRIKYPYLSGSLMQVYFDRNDQMKGEPRHVFARWLIGRM